MNRIDYGGKAYDDTFISNRSSQVAECITKEMRLQTAREIQQARRKEREIKHPDMKYIKELARATLAQGEVDSIAKFVNLFNREGSEKGLRAEAYYNKGGIFQGLRFYGGEHKFKASEIDRSLSKQHIENLLQRQVTKVSESEFLVRIGESASNIDKKLDRPYRALKAISILGSVMSSSSNKGSEEVSAEGKKKLEKKRGIGMRR